MHPALCCYKKLAAIALQGRSVRKRPRERSGPPVRKAAAFPFPPGAQCMSLEDLVSPARIEPATR